MNTNINKLEAIIVVFVMSQSAGYSGTEVGTCQEPHTGGIRQDVLYGTSSTRSYDHILIY